jgi:hypothetical protein
MGGMGGVVCMCCYIVAAKVAIFFIKNAKMCGSLKKYEYFYRESHSGFLLKNVIG